MNDPLVEMLSCVTDARREQAKRYGLASILLFCIFGFLCGAKSYKTLCSFIEERFTLLQAAFPSKMKRAPAPSTLWRIIGLVDSGSLEAVFRRHAAMQHAALGGGPGEVVAHDGKSLKGSYDTAHEQKMSHLFRAFAVGTKIILGHVAIMAKSNEIPAMQALVRELGLAGVLCTADAMHCQIKTIEAVKAAGGEALLQVKANQPSLAAAFEALPAGHKPRDCHVEIGTIRRNRQEKRVVDVFRAGHILDLAPWQTHAVEAVRVTRRVLHKDVATGWNPARQHRRLLCCCDPRPLGRREPRPLRARRLHARGCQSRPQEPDHPLHPAQLRPEHLAVQSDHQRRRRPMAQRHEPQPCPGIWRNMK